MRFRHKQNFLKRLASVSVSTALAASLFLFPSCSMFDTDDDDDSSNSVASGSLTIAGDLDALATVSSTVDVTLSLSGATFASAGVANITDLTDYITIKAGNATSSKVIVAEDFAAGASSIKVKATITGASLGEGSLGAVIRGNLISSRSAVSANGGSYLFKGADVTDTSLTVTPSEAFSQEYTISLEGFEFATTDTSTLANYITVTDSADTAGDDLGEIAVAVSSVSTDSAVVTISGTPARNTYEEGELTFTLASGAIKNVTDTLSCVTKPSYVINGGTASISASSLSITGYGTVDATCTSGTITLALDHATFSSTSVASDVLTVTDSNGLTPTISNWTIANDLASASFKVSVSKDLESSADNTTGTLSFSLNAAGTSLGSGTLAITSTVSYALNYKSYLTYPSASDVLTATGSDTNAGVYTTVINLAAFDESVSLASSLSAGATVATGTIGTTSVTAVAVSAVSAGATKVPVKIATTATGAVSLTTASGVVASPITITQTNTAHIATALSYVQDFESSTDIDDYSITVQDATKSASEIATSETTLINSGNPIPSSYGNVWRHYNVSNSNGVRGAYLPLSNIPSSGNYVIEFDARLAGSNLTNGDHFIITNASRANGTTINNYIFAMDCTTANTGSRTTESIAWNLYNGNTSASDTTVSLREDLFYHYKVTVNRDDETVTVAVNCADDSSVASPLSETEVSINGSSYSATGIWLGTCKQLLAEQMIDNIVVYSLGD